MAMSCGVGHRLGWDLVWLWLWCRPAATAPIQLLAWKPPYAPGVALKRRKIKNKKKEMLQLGERSLCAGTVLSALLINSHNLHGDPVRRVLLLSPWHG